MNSVEVIMQDFFVIAIVVISGILLVRLAIKRFKGGGSCSGCAHKNTCGRKPD